MTAEGIVMTDLVQKIAEALYAADLIDHEYAAQGVIRQALAGHGEAQPVAWLYRVAGSDSEGSIVRSREHFESLAKHGGFEIAPLYAHPTPDAGRVAELELEIVAPTCNQDGLLEALEGLLSVVSVRIDDPRIKQFDAARHAVAIVKGGMK